MNTVLRLKREISESAGPGQKAAGGYAGYLLKVTVDSAHNIVPEIFVMQRDVYTPYAGEYTDTFYSIASVAELEFLPAGAPTPDSTNFYRTSVIELMFESLNELEGAWSTISGEVLLLAEANDLSINVIPDLVAIYPEDAFLRYYGTSDASPTVGEIQLLQNDNVYSAKLSVSLDFAGSSHFVFAYPSSVGTGALELDGIATDVTLSTANMVTKYGQTVPYNIYVTDGPVADGAHLVTFSQQ